MTAIQLASRIRARVESLPPQTRAAWQWDMLTGVFAGLYQGCVWTFVARVARADMHASAPQMGLLAAAPAVGYLFATVWAGHMEGRAKLPFVYWTWLVSRGAFLLTPLIATRDQYVALVCLTPIIFSVSTPAYTAVMKDIYPERMRGRLMSAVRVGASTSTLVTALVVGRLMDHGASFRLMFEVGGVFGALTAWSFSRIRVPASAQAGPHGASTRAFVRDTIDILWRNPGYRWFSLSILVYGFGNLMASTIYPIYQVDHFHVTNTQVANLQNIAALATITGYVVWGLFLDRKGPQMTVLVCILLICGVPFCYAIAWAFPVLYLAAAFSGIAASGIDIGYINTILLYAEPGREAQYQSLHSTFFGIRGTLAPLCAIPILGAVGARPSFRLCVAIMLVGVLVQVAAMRSYGRERQRARGHSASA